MDDALCAQVDPELFFPGVGEPTEPAKEICARCPVRTECEDFGRTASRGVWGGKSGRNRQIDRSQVQ